jgi:hypothetical protein
VDNQEELLTAWAAGFIDGEGVVYISKGKPSQRGVSPRYNLVVQVGCTRLEPLLRLQELFGGSICTNTNKRKPHWKPKFVWNVSALKAVSCISRVLPYLSIKREQACLGLELEQLKAIKTNSKKLALTACELRTREVIYQKVKILNERGKPKRSLQLQLKKGEQ